MSDERNPALGVYGISVAAELTGLGVQMLRQYEERGLLRPDRTGGGTRRYSEDDLDRLRRIKELLVDGLNLAGIGLVLALEDDNHRLERENGLLRSERDTDTAADTAADAAADTDTDIGADAPRRPGRTS